MLLCLKYTRLTTEMAMGERNMRNMQMKFWHVCPGTCSPESDPGQARSLTLDRTTFAKPVAVLQEPVIIFQTWPLLLAAARITAALQHGTAA
jgi:hypothetical protein